MIIIILGAPGSGKGTVAKLFSEMYKIEHISTGDIFREEIQKGTQIGKKLEKTMVKGSLVPDEIAIEAIEQRLERPSAKNGVVLDGFPRTRKQAEFLKEALDKKNKRIDVAVMLNISEEEIIERTVQRRICSNKKCGAIYNLKYNKPKEEGICDKCGSMLIRREDDNFETIKRRITTYHTRSEPVIKFFEEEGILYNVYLKAEYKVTKEDIKKWMEKIK